jgi:hypothetical protein
MSDPLITFNNYHLGDNINFLNYAKRVVLYNADISIKHYCLQALHHELAPFIEGVPQVELADIADYPGGGIDTWINSDGSWDAPFINHNWVFEHIGHFRRLSKELGVSEVIKTRDDFLFSYPELYRGNSLTEASKGAVLLINSRPMSGQFQAYDTNSFAALVKWIQDEKGLNCITTEPTCLCPSTIEAKLSVAQIGALSRRCKVVMAVDTGPMWPTFTAHNDNELRIVFCDRHIFPLTDNTVTVNAVSAVPDIFKFWGI